MNSKSPRRGEAHRNPAHPIEILERRIAPATVLNLSSLTGPNGFQISGETYDSSGFSVSGAGDVNGDGFDDVLIGAPFADPNGLNSGTSYVVFGKADGFAANLNLLALDGSNGFRINGEAAYDSSGYSVSGAGDVNGDGFGDLLIGANFADPSGASYVVFGKAGGFAANLNLSALDGSNGFQINGEAAGDYSSRSVSAAGDVNGDGFDDVLIGAQFADPNGFNSGASYVVFGKAGGFAANLDLSTLDGSNGFQINGEAPYDRSGFSVSGAGDVNGDGFEDLLIGARFATPNGVGSGASYLVFGKAGGFAANLDLSALNGSNGFQISGEAAFDHSGHSVSGAGDINGDGFDDLLIGAYGVDVNGFVSGASYVVFGKAGGFAANLNLSTLNGSNGFQINGEAMFDSSGFSVSGAGDFNGDGFDDLLIGAHYADPNGIDSGGSYLVFGKAVGFAANLNLSALNGSNGFQISGETAGDLSGWSVSGAGDLNGDGFDDLLIGARSAKPNGFGSGASYVVFGGRMVFINDVAVTETDAGTVTASFTVVLTASSTDAVSVEYATADGTAAAPGDYTALPLTTLTFAPGERMKTIDVSVQGDAVGEPDETFFVNLSNPLNASIAGGQGRGTILTDEPPPVISIDDVAVEETDAGTVVTSFMVSLSAPNTAPVTVQYSTADGTAVAPGDYTTIPLTTLTFDIGETTKTIMVSVNGDSLVEGNEVFFVNLSSPTNAILADNRGQGLIVSDEVTSFLGELSALDGANGFRINGEAAEDFAGNTVEDVGDINGDGFADVAVTAYRADTNGMSDAGATYVIFGKGSGFAATLELSALDGTNGFQINGVSNFDISGVTVGAAGDVNGDGIDDLAIGAFPSGVPADPTQNGSGATYVLFGSTAGFPANVNLSALNGTNGFRINGVAATDQSGIATNSAGDFNGDGIDDLVVGAWHADTNGPDSGAAYVVFGKNTGFAASIDLAALDGTNGFRIKGVAAGDSAGYAASGVGDVNGDGFDDLIIGAPFADANGSDSGAAYVVFGKGTGFTPDLELSALNGTNGFKINGAGGFNKLAYGATGAGDVNGDGFADLIVAASQAGPSGVIYVIFGKDTFPAALELSSLNGKNGFTVNGAAGGDLFGRSVDGAGDVNGDGFDDLVVGARNADPNGPDSGAAYVIFGKASKFARTLEASALSGTQGFKLNGVNQGDQAGIWVSGAGDMNGDGFDDIIIAADYASPNGRHSGSSYVVFGRVTIAADGRSAGFIDDNGDLVNVTTSKGAFTQANFTFQAKGLGAHLDGVDLLGNPSFAGANITITARLQDVNGDGTKDGDGTANVGHIGATGIDLGKVTIAGDLLAISAGDADANTPGVKSLAVKSLGTAPHDIGVSTESTLVGGAKEITVNGDAQGVNLLATGNGAKFGKITVKGSLEDSLISIAGLTNPPKDSASVVLKSLKVSGAVMNTQIIAGAETNADVQIGKVSVGRDWVASDLVAGAVATDGFFGDDNDALAASNNAIVAGIARITIKGAVIGTAGGGDSFGFVAQRIGGMKVAGARIIVADDLLFASTNDVRVQLL